MKKSLNKNVYYLSMSLPINGIDAAPVVASVTLLNDLITRIGFFNSTPRAFVRALDIEHQIMPVSGYMLANNNGFNWVELDREIEGPPWVFEIQAYNPDATAATLHILIEAGDSKEKDINALILAQLEILNERFSK